MRLPDLLSDLLGIPAVAPTRLRQEIFSLGGRHRGEALAGALLELEDPRLSADRKALLRSVIRHLTPASTGLPGARSRIPPFNRALGSVLVRVLAATACAILIGVALFAGR